MPHARPPATNMMPPPIIAPATPRPTRSNSTSNNSGTVNHTVCDRKPMLRAARNAPITIIRPDAAVTAGDNRRSPSGPGCLPPPRQHQARLRGERDRQSRQIAHRPHRQIPEQRARRGDRSRGERRRRPRGSASRRCDGSCSAKTRYRATRSPASPPTATAPPAPSPRSPMRGRVGAEAGDRRRDLAEEM